MEQGLRELGNKRTDSPPTVRKTTPNTLVVDPPGSPLGNLFFGNPSLLILPDPFSSNTPLPFL